MARRFSRLSILAFRPCDPLHVLLMAPSASHGWRLPCGIAFEGERLHISAARWALREAGVSGRIYTRSLRLDHQQPPLVVFPLLVQSEEAPRTSEGLVKPQWFSMAEAMERVDEALWPVFEALTKRISDKDFRGERPTTEGANALAESRDVLAL